MMPLKLGVLILQIFSPQTLTLRGVDSLPALHTLAPSTLQLYCLGCAPVRRNISPNLLQLVQQSGHGGAPQGGICGWNQWGEDDEEDFYSRMAQCGAFSVAKEAVVTTECPPLIFPNTTRGSMQNADEYAQTQFAYCSAKLPIVVLLPCNV